MKITDTRKNEKKRPNIFADLTVGDVFENRAGEICVKLAGHQRQNNAFCFQSNALVTYQKNSFAKAVNAELVIHTDGKEKANLTKK